MLQMVKQWILQASLMCCMQTFGLCAIFSARRYHYSSLSGDPQKCSPDFATPERHFERHKAVLVSRDCFRRMHKGQL